MYQRSSSDNVLSSVSEYVRLNLLGLSQYIFVSSQKHKELKTSINTLPLEITSTSEIIDYNKNFQLFDEIEDNLFKLEEFLQTVFYQIFWRSYKEVVAIHFCREPSNILPRLCIKVKTDDDLSTLFREPASPIQDIKTSIDDNTAFSDISNGEPYYLCNNIPEAVVLGKYRNLRIKPELASDYFRQSKEYSTGLSQKWVECWKESVSIDNETIKTPVETCYMSTLVIPMSLKTSELHPSFMKKFKIDIKSERAIFGYLCFDHPKIDFFSENRDVGIGSIIADFLSLYLIQQLVCTTYSSTYCAAKKMINEKELNTSKRSNYYE